MLNLCRELWNLIWHWWTGDRIRVSPVEGRLLRVQPGDLLTVAGIDAEVIDRSVIAEHCLCLTCRTATSSATLCVTLSSASELQRLSWIESGRETLLSAADVEVWPRSFRSAERAAI